MIRLKITLSYDGSRYLGFQIQKEHKESVAYELYKAFKSLNILDTFQASGRTDKGVHARRQVIHIDVPHFWSDTKKLHTLLNRKLPDTINILSIQKVSSDFHARFSARKRCYHYILTTKKPSVFESAYVTFHPHIDKERIQEGLSCFIGQHDFEFFQKSGGDTSTSVREIFSTKLTKKAPYYIITVCANGFLRSQIRLMVQALLEVNDDILSLEALKEQINKEKRHSTKIAPPNGLYLAHITYGPHH